MKEITLGQFYPGNSFLHRLDPRLKLIGSFIYIVLAFIANSFIGLALLAGWFLLLGAVSRVPWRMLFGSLKSVYFLLLFTFILNAFLFQGSTLLFSWWFIRLTGEGLIRAVFLALRLLLLVSGTTLLTLTTTPIALTDGLESLMHPLKKIGFPAHEIAMMMSIALRFIPTLLEETDRIMRAQASRGASFTEGGLFQRARALLPLLIPLFVSAFRRAEELALAMEARCYHGGEGRTRYHVLRYSARDGFALLVLLFVSALIVADAVLAPALYPLLMNRM